MLIWADFRFGLHLAHGLAVLGFEDEHVRLFE